MLDSLRDVVYNTIGLDLRTLDKEQAVTYGFAFLLPILYIAFKILAPGSSSTVLNAEESSEAAALALLEEKEKKPLKSIMQPAVEDLAPPKDDVYTVEELSEYDGRNGGKIWVAIKGTIFDVTRKADVYGPGQSYHIFAGKDGSRGLGMSSLKEEHAVADYSTLEKAEAKVLDDWYAFFSKRYNIVGRVASSS